MRVCRTVQADMRQTDRQAGEGVLNLRFVFTLHLVSQTGPLPDSQASFQEIFKGT